MSETHNNKPTGPLSGLRVLDLSRILAGPYCTQLLGDYGADIIKVERPGLGDDTRSWGPPYVTDSEGEPTSESAYYLSTNRNKRSIAVDISTEEGAAVVKKLVRHCDIMIENFKVDGLKKYGLDHEAILKDHPGLIYCSISGFGQTGPNASKPGYDLLVQAFGGIMSLTGEAEGDPMKVGVAVADVMCGMYASTAILAALRHRDQTGEGQYIDIGLADTQIAWLINQGTNYLTSGKEPVRHGNEHPNIVPYQVFSASDGHVIVAAGNDTQFTRFCQLLDLDQLAKDSRFAGNAVRVKNREILIPLLSNRIKQMRKQTLVEGMEKLKIPGGVINTLPGVFASEQIAARDMKVSMPHALAGTGKVDLIGNPVKFSKTPVSYHRAPPTCGEHTDEIIRELLS